MIFSSATPAGPEAAPRIASLPPGPRGAIWQTLRYVSNPQAYYLRCVARYGDMFTVPSVLGKVVAISRPSHLRALFSLPPDAFERWSVNAVEPLLGARSVLLTSGELHLQQRRMIAPAFHGARIQAMAGRISHITNAHATQWPEGRSFRLQDKLVDLSIDVVLGTVLGIDDELTLRSFRKAILNTLAAMGPTLMLARAVDERLAALGPYAKFLRARRELDQLLFTQIDLALVASGNAEHVLSMLVAARDEAGRGYGRDELRDQLMTLIFAGHETSAIALTWSIYWLHRCPETLLNLEQELAEHDECGRAEVARLPYLDSVCKESLRLHPTVPEVIRKLKQPLQLDGTYLPAGTAVAACIVATHHREDLYAEASQFRPARFAHRRYAGNEYLPFGGGVHRCAGEAFAWLEMKVILATLIRRWQFSLVNSRPATPVLRSITMEPRGGVPVIVRGRK